MREKEGDRERMKVIEREKEERERRRVRERKRGRERVNESGSELSRISQVCKTNDMVGQILTLTEVFFLRTSFFTTERKTWQHKQTNKQKRKRKKTNEQ